MAIDPALRERLQVRADQANTASSPESIEALLRETAKPVLLALAQNPHLQERDLLRLLERKDLAAEVVSELANHRSARGKYDVQFALARHPRTPRMVSLPILKFLYLFDLLRVAQTPGVPSDVRNAAEEAILKKLAGIPRGDQISLARRGTGRLAASLLVGGDPDIVCAALNNPYLTEAHLIKALSNEDVPPVVVALISEHGRWSHCYTLRLALIRSPHTPFARVLGFLPEIAVPDLREICLDRRLPAHLRNYVQAHCQSRLARRR
jgi:hypothetical protein